MARKTRNEDRIHLSETEERLIQDKDGQYREELLKQLVDEAFRLKKIQEKGISPDEFDQSSTMMTAVLAAAEVVDKTWSKYHGN